MLSLQLLGGLSLVDDAGALPGTITQRRRLALLARLAAAPQGSLSRDKLVACFWPDEDRERARHFLADSLFTLRRGLGKEVVRSVGDDLVLSFDAFTCDLWRFREALERGEREEAVALYGGPFLDGFFVSDAPEFERWVEEERSRVATTYALALERLAEDAEAAGDAGVAATWWRRLAAQDPFSSRVALRLMRALTASGDRAAAVQHARTHAVLLREELEVEADPAVEALAAELAAGGPAGVTPRAAVEAGVEAPPGDDGGPDVRLEAARPQAVDLPADQPSTARRRRRAAQRTGAILVPLLLVALLATTAMWGRVRQSGLWFGGAEAAAEPGTTTIAVLPFHYRGTPEHAYLGEGLVTLLSTGLDGAGSLRTVTPYALLSRTSGMRDDRPISPEVAGEIASDLRAGHFVLGTVVGSETSITITASLFQHGPTPTVLATVSVEGTPADPLADDLARQLLEGELSAAADRLPRIALRTTSSLPALKAYLEGEREFRAARYLSAVDALQRAVREDPEFALAHFRLSMASEWSFRFPEARQAAAEALRLGTQLSSRDQQLIAAWERFLSGDAEAAASMYGELLVDDRNHVEAWSGLGETRLHYNPSRGRSTADAIAAFDQVLRLAPDFGEARFHLLEFAARAGDRARFQTLLRDVDAGSPQRLSWELAQTLSWGADPPSADSLSARLRATDELVIGIAAVRAAVHFRDLVAADRLAMLLTEDHRLASWRDAGRILRAQGYLARGAWAMAAAQLDAAAAGEPAWTLEMRALAALLPEREVGRGELLRLRESLESWDPRERNPRATFFFGVHVDAHAHLRHYLLALLSIRLGDDAEAARQGEALRSAGGSSTAGELARSLALSVEANRAWHRRDGEETLALLEAARMQAPLERVALSPFFAQAPDRYLRAEVLRSLGRPDEALAWYASLTDGPDLLWWRVAHRRQAEILRALGRMDEADRHERAAAALSVASPASP